jgi:glycosyltransferase involved in cell wall biosynthesis
MLSIVISAYNEASNIEELYKHVKNIRFTGYLTEEEVPRIFNESTLVVFPYTSTTGSSGVLHQAGSYGKPAIMPNLGDLAMLVKEEGYVGEFFEPNDVESLANAIQKVLEDDEYRIRLGRQNYFASASLPMKDLIDWYYLHFQRFLKK